MFSSYLKNPKCWQFFQMMALEGWKAGRHKQGGDTIWFQYGDNDADSLSWKCCTQLFRWTVTEIAALREKNGSWREKLAPGSFLISTQPTNHGVKWGWGLEVSDLLWIWTAVVTDSAQSGSWQGACMKGTQPWHYVEGRVLQDDVSFGSDPTLSAGVCTKLPKLKAREAPLLAWIGSPSITLILSSLALKDHSALSSGLTCWFGLSFCLVLNP